MAVIEGRLRLVALGVDDDLVVEWGPRESAQHAPAPNAPAPNAPAPNVPASDTTAPDTISPDTISPDTPAPDADRLTPRRLPSTAEDVAAGRVRYEVTVDGWVIVVTAESADRAALRERATRLSAVTGHAGPQTVKAKIPGRVARVWVTPGMQVQHGDRLLSIEAMKMENEVRAPRAGTVSSVFVSVGDRVELGSDLAVVG